MTDATYTHIAFLLDRSGSMQTIKTDTQGGFDAYIASQRSQPGRCTVTLAQFDEHYEEVIVATDIGAVPPLDLQPRGTTALNDSIARLVLSTGDHLSALPEEQRPGTVIFGIMTDGLENASKEWSRAAVKKLIEQQEQQYDWTFSYLGANQDAVEVGATLGIPAPRSLTYGTGHAADAMNAYSASSTRLRGAVAAGAAVGQARAQAGYSPAQRAAAVGAHAGADAGAAADADAGTDEGRPTTVPKRHGTGGHRAR